MGCQDVLTRKTGVIVGDGSLPLHSSHKIYRHTYVLLDVLKLFNYAQEHKFAIPAIVSPAEAASASIEQF